MFVSMRRLIVMQKSYQKSQLSYSVSKMLKKQSPQIVSRLLLSSSVSSSNDNNDNTVKVIYVTKDGKSTEISGKIGDNAMYLAHHNNIEIEGACEASLACCTCHVYVDDKYYDLIPPPKEEEEDMLDMAPFLKPNSRLSCQIILTKELDGIELTLPAATRNFYVDGHTPKPH